MASDLAKETARQAPQKTDSEAQSLCSRKKAGISASHCFRSESSASGPGRTRNRKRLRLRRRPAGDPLDSARTGAGEAGRNARAGLDG